MSIVIGTERMIDLSAKRGYAKLALMITKVQVPPQPFLARNYEYPALAEELDAAHAAAAAARRRRVTASYDTRTFEGSSTLRVHSMIRASTAAPAYFEAATFPRFGDAQRFIDGGLLANCPAAVGCHEAMRLWPTRRIDTVLSLGTGTGLPAAAASGYKSLIVTLVKAATSPQLTDTMLSDFLPRLGAKYFRHSPIRAELAIGLDEVREEELKKMISIAKEEIEKRAEEIEELATWLRRGNIQNE